MLRRRRILYSDDRAYIGGGKEVSVQISIDLGTLVHSVGRSQRAGATPVTAASLYLCHRHLSKTHLTVDGRLFPFPW